MTPATPLPWYWLPNEGQFIVGDKKKIVAEIPCQGCEPLDGEFIVHAANAYPRLVEALRHLSTPAHGKDMGHALPSIDQAKAARALLRELGELE